MASIVDSFISEDGANRPNQEGAIKARYERLRTVREPVLKRARKCSELTIPSLLPPQEDNTQSMVLPTPYQSLGARGTNNLASKLLLALFPPNTPFYREVVSDQTLVELGMMGQRTQVEESLNQIEREVMSWIETNALRVPSFEALKLLIVTGNCIVYLPDQGGTKVYKLDSYVIRRDPMGNVIDMIIREKIHPEVLPQDLQDQVNATDSPDQKNVELYTWIYRADHMWHVRQEVNGIPYPDGSGEYPLDECPWIPLRWTAVTGEDYGRGLVEEYIGDLNSLEELTKALVEFTSAASRVIPLVNPSGSTDIKRLSKAKNGEYVPGNKDDITFLQIEKYNDFQVCKEVINEIKNDLSYSFLLYSAIQRDAERVTAEEIRQMVKELEDALGGVYSVLSQEYQLPLVRRIKVQMEKQGKLPKLPKDIVKPMIVTGLEALGRGNDLNKLLTFKEAIKDDPEAQAWIKKGNFIKRVGTSIGIDTKDLVMSQEEYDAMQQQAMMTQMVQGAIPGVAQETVKGMNNANAIEQQQQQATA